MVSNMKTTIEIADPLLDEARRVARAEGSTVRALVEAGLRKVLSEKRRRPGFRLRRAAFRGTGLQPDVAGASWEELRDLAYKGRAS